MNFGQWIRLYGMTRCADWKWTYGDEARPEPTSEDAVWLADVTSRIGAVERALEAADGKDVHLMGGADVIRQALAAGVVEATFIDYRVQPVLDTHRG